MDKITAGWSKLSEDGQASASNFLYKAITVIDGALGEGYAAKNPGLIGDFMKTAALDAGMASIAKTIQEHAEELKEIYVPIKDGIWSIKDSIDDI